MYLLFATLGQHETPCWDSLFYDNKICKFFQCMFQEKSCYRKWASLFEWRTLTFYNVKKANEFRMQFFYVFISANITLNFWWRGDSCKITARNRCMYFRWFLINYFEWFVYRHFKKNNFIAILKFATVTNAKLSCV